MYAWFVYEALAAGSCCLCWKLISVISKIQHFDLFRIAWNDSNIYIFMLNVFYFRFVFFFLQWNPPSWYLVQINLIRSAMKCIEKKVQCAQPKQFQFWLKKKKRENLLHQKKRKMCGDKKDWWWWWCERTDERRGYQISANKKKCIYNARIEIRIQLMNITISVAEKLFSVCVCVRQLTISNWVNLFVSSIRLDWCVVVTSLSSSKNLSIYVFFFFPFI